MKPFLVSVLVLMSLVGCGEASEPSEVSSSKRCDVATALEKQYEKEVELTRNQISKNPDTAELRFHRDLERGKVFFDGFRMVSVQQRVYQVISDNPTCFKVGEVSDARMALKIIDAAILRASSLAAKTQKDSELRELDRLWEKERDKL